jgi:ketosteroid isomerase-like protein
MKQLALNYFAAWNAQDARWLTHLFDNDVTLVDWDNSVSGLIDVVEMNRKIWADVPDIKATVLDIAESEQHCIAKLLIQIDDDTSIDVVDVFTMKDGKITSIKAYKG